MDEATLKLLQDFATQARTVAAVIEQPPRSNAIRFLGQEPPVDVELRNISEQMLGLAKKITAYLAERGQ